MKTLRFDIAPMGKVRMTQSDKWKVGEKARPCVKRYRAYHDALRAAGATLQDGDAVYFYLEMPKSWSAKKRAEMKGQPHRQKPDLDNLLGGLMDGVMDEDKALAHIGNVKKLWHDTAAIIILRRDD